VGLILDSSVAIAAERRGDTVQALLKRAIDAAGDQEAALSTIAVIELVHGIHRADTAERRARRESFVEELLAAVAVYPLTTDAARLALDGEEPSVADEALIVGYRASLRGPSTGDFLSRLPGLSQPDENRRTLACVRQTRSGHPLRWRV
jgi:predicted nucleic acid-binding protein